MNIYTYGCSFTRYFYPTWSDILAQDYTVHNRAWPGCGNERIFYFVMEDYKKGLLQDADIIAVQWTGFYRWDYLTRSGWSNADGAIMHSADNAWIWKRIKTWYNLDYEKNKTQNYMISINAILQSLAAKKVFLSYEDCNFDFINHNNLFETYKGNYVLTNVPWSDQPVIDDHPNLIQHLELANSIAPITQQTTNKVQNLHIDILKDTKWREFEL